MRRILQTFRTFNECVEKKLNPNPDFGGSLPEIDAKIKGKLAGKRILSLLKKQ